MSINLFWIRLLMTAALFSGIEIFIMRYTNIRSTFWSNVVAFTTIFWLMVIIGSTVVLIWTGW